MCEGQGRTDPPPAPADDIPTELARGAAPPPEPTGPAPGWDRLQAALARLDGQAPTPGTGPPPVPESVTTPATAAVLSCLTPAERSAYDSATPGKRKNLVNLLKLGMDDVVRSELATIAAGMKRPRLEPESAPLPALLDSLPGTSDPSLVTVAGARLKLELGDHDGSSRFLEQVASKVQSGLYPPEKVLHILDYARKAKNPPAYFARTTKSLERELCAVGVPS